MKDDINNSNSIETEPLIDVYVYNNDAVKKQPFDTSFVSVEAHKASELSEKIYSPKKDVSIVPGMLFRRNVSKGDLLVKDDIIFPSDEDYMYLSLNEGQLPYWLDVTELVINNAVVFREGDYVNLYLLSKKERAGRTKNTTGLISDIVNYVKILKVNEIKKDNKKSLYTIVLSLTIDEIKKVEKSKVEGDIRVVLSTNTRPRGEDLISVYKLNSNVVKGDLVDSNLLSTVTVNKGALTSINYSDLNEIEIYPDAIFRHGLKKGEIVSNFDIVNKFDDDYGLQLLKDKEVPYWFDVSSLISNGILRPVLGDYVSFVYYKKNDSNKKITVTSNIIVHRVRVLNVSEMLDPLSMTKKQQLLLAMEMDDILKIETAKLTGTVNVIITS
ncbi:MAG: hypothetical protein ACRDD9_13555, partial [Shewanella sp.]